MFWSRRTEAILAALRAENADLRAQLRLERSQSAAQIQALLDRLMAATNPAALREVRRTPGQEPVPTAPEQRRRLNYPVSAAPSLRPPSPPSHPVPGTVPLTDAQLAAVITTFDTYNPTPYSNDTKPDQLPINFPAPQDKAS